MAAIALGFVLCLYRVDSLGDGDRLFLWPPPARQSSGVSRFRHISGLLQTIKVRCSERSDATAGTVPKATTSRWTRHIIWAAGSNRQQKRFADLDGPDFYPTPRWAGFALIENERFQGDARECACGDGAMCTVLIDRTASGWSLTAR